MCAKQLLRCLNENLGYSWAVRSAADGMPFQVSVHTEGAEELDQTWCPPETKPLRSLSTGDNLHLGLPAIMRRQKHGEFSFMILENELPVFIVNSFMRSELQDWEYSRSHRVNR